MDNVDDLLNRLATAPQNGRLTTIDDAVLSALADYSASGPRASVQIAALACIAALGLGVLSAGLSVEAAHAETTAFDIGAAAAMAPSTLLFGR